MLKNMRNKAIMVCLAALIALAGADKAVAQTYSGYLKIDDVNGNGPDSLHVTITVPEVAYKTRTIYVVDTVYVERDFRNSSVGRDTRKPQRPYMRSESPSAPVKESSAAGTRSSRNTYKGYYATPWMFGVKTNLLSDVLAIPSLGFEVQLYDNLSLDLGGWWSQWNILYPNKQTRIYGGAPELRWWFGDEMMRRGHFIGLHGMVAWYTFEWREKDGTKVIYQNGLDDIKDAGSTSPSWSCGLTYGYSLPLDRTGNFGLEFYAGLGYQFYKYKRIIPSEGWNYYTHYEKRKVGLTKIGVNLTYRFSLRKVKH